MATETTVRAHVLTLVRAFERGESSQWAQDYIARSVPRHLWTRVTNDVIVWLDARESNAN